MFQKSPTLQREMKNMITTDKKITKIYGKNIGQMKCRALLKKNKKTINSIIGLCEGGHELKKGILGAIRNRNIYAANVLFRSLLEHFVKFLYVTYRYGQEKNDDVGTDNFIFSRAVEIKDYGNALKLATKLLGQDESSIDDKAAITKFNHEAGAMSFKKLKGLNEQFNFRTIIKFFEENEPEFFKEQLQMFPPSIIEYSELSTYVHGGAYANEYGADLSTKSIKELTHRTVVISATFYTLTFISLSNDYFEAKYVAAEISKIVNAELSET